MSLQFRLIFFISCLLSVGGQRVFCQSTDTFSDETKRTVCELIDIDLENALSFRNYEVLVQKSTIFDPIQENSKATAFLSVLNIRIFMDWDNRKCIFLKHSYDETVESDAKQNENFCLFKFENGFRTVCLLRDRGQPVVENMTFERFLKSSGMPLAERVGLCTFKYIFDKPFEQEAMECKKFERVKGMQVRQLPDGTIVRHVQFGKKAINTTHFDPVTQLAIYSSVTGTEREPPVSQTIEYELAKGVYRPMSIALNEYTFHVDEKTKLDGSNIQFMKGIGTVKYTWNQFNESALEFKDDKQLIGGNRDDWKAFLDLP